MPAQPLRALPSIDALLRAPAAQALRARAGAARLTTLARAVTDELRAELQAQSAGANGAVARAALLAEACARLVRAVERDEACAPRRVINATGVILHTNLGRAPLSAAARRAITEEAAGYCTLEYDLATGTRGRRGAQVETLVAELTGAEAALVVNNCAAAALLVLTALARGHEAIVSRGELVEIGGDFRVPDVMAQSGAQMREVGTTNRTKLADYERAINEQTKLILRVHPSNYRIVGFASSPTRAELAALAQEAGLPLYEDAGSGQLSDLREYGVNDEPVVREIVEQGVDVASFSGDKLLGSAQAGIIVGKETIVSRLRKHPLYRALRSDKLRLAALEATLSSHQRDLPQVETPAIQMLALTAAELERRARSLVEAVGPSNGIRLELQAGESAVGGGAGPTSTLPTTLIAITHTQKSVREIEHQLRTSSPPIISRISEGKVLLDLRTVFEDELPALLNALNRI